MKPLYTVERWPLGWTISSPVYQAGIPVNALGECLSLVPRKGLMDAGIAHHLRHSGHPNVVLCMVTASNSTKWRAEITELLSNAPPEDQWFRGFEVGASSATIFSVFCFAKFNAAAKKMSNGAAPLDASDFGRCVRLLEKFPQWRASLHRVAEAYPNGKWPALVARWDELEAATPEVQNQILNSLTQG